MTRSPLSLAALLAFPLFCSAQVYSWKDPQTGTLMMSSTPPVWYSARVPVPGPRVVVSIRGRDVDDTARSIEERQAMQRGMRAEAPRAPNSPTLR